jgi:hypothetical protein
MSKADPRTPNSRQADLKLQQLDVKRAAADLARRVQAIRRSVAEIEAAKAVTHRLLQKEVSI